MTMLSIWFWGFKDRNWPFQYRMMRQRIKRLPPHMRISGRTVETTEMDEIRLQISEWIYWLCSEENRLFEVMFLKFEVNQDSRRIKSSNSRLGKLCQLIQLQASRTPKAKRESITSNSNCLNRILWQLWWTGDDVSLCSQSRLGSWWLFSNKASKLFLWEGGWLESR